MARVSVAAVEYTGPAGAESAACTPLEYHNLRLCSSALRNSVLYGAMVRAARLSDGLVP
jgi:hypothetical protein